MIKRPLWRCGNRRDAKAMVAWVNEHLERAEALSKNFQNYFEFLETEFGPSYKEAIRRADKGDVEPLRKLFPPIWRGSYSVRN